MGFGQWADKSWRWCASGSVHGRRHGYAQFILSVTSPTQNPWSRERHELMSVVLEHYRRREDKHE